MNKLRVFTMAVVAALATACAPPSGECEGRFGGVSPSGSALADSRFVEVRASCDLPVVDTLIVAYGVDDAPQLAITVGLEPFSSPSAFANDLRFGLGSSAEEGSGLLAASVAPGTLTDGELEISFRPGGRMFGALRLVDDAGDECNCTFDVPLESVREGETSCGDEGGGGDGDAVDILF